MSAVDIVEHAFSTQGLALTARSTRVAALKLEGQAMADMAAAIPLLTTGDIDIVILHHDDIECAVYAYSDDHHCRCHCISW